ncbi:hypothetical protein GGS24DRAFT_510668 [Hypoxylon argillaceum]|nr:hypothetical protein GGS24DRAFT_510668 [Hypoxylon argillaceum]
MAISRHEEASTSTSSIQFHGVRSPLPPISDAYRQDNYKFSPAGLNINQVFQGSQMASGGEKLTNDRCDIATNSGFDSSGSDQRKSQLRDAIRSTLAKSSSSTTDTFDEDNNTEYSDALSLCETKIEIFISEFAKELAAVLPHSISANQLSSLSAALPSLLKAFAIRFGQEENTTLQFQLMYLVHRYRNQISKAVVDTFAIEEQETEEESQNPSIAMPIQDKMDLWNRKNDQLTEDPNSVVAQTHTENTDHIEFDQFPEDDDEDFLEGFPEIQEYRQILLNSPAYSWLLKSAIIEVELEIPEGVDDARGKIRRKIIEFLGEPSRISQKDAPASQPIVFQLPWIRDYLISQEYNMPLHQVFPRALVVVGVDDQSFVTNCSEYLETLWPDIGPQILNLCISLLSNPCGFVASCTLLDKTEVSAEIDFKGSTVEFFVVGTIYSLAEIGELVAWLSAAFNNGCSGQNLFFRYPTCNIRSPFLDPPSVNQKPDLAKSALYLNFHFADSPAQSTPNADSEGRCWVKIFGNRPAVSGYPIPRRQVKRTGVEIRLGLMSQLINASIADTNYSIGWSALKPPRPGFAFEKISIVGGMFITSGVSTLIGKRDKAVIQDIEMITQ